MPSDRKLQGVGVGLRWEILDDVLAHLDDPSVHADLAAVPFFEISPENYMRRGGYYPAALDRVRARYPLLTHGLTMSIGSTDPVDDGYMRELCAFEERVDPPFHSDHLCFCGVSSRMLHDLLPLPLTRAAASHVAGRIRAVEDRLRRPFAIENITHYLVPGAPSLDDSELVAEVLARSGAGLLLDVNNVFVNARNYGLDPIAWLRAMPLDRVVEIHIAGHERSEADGLLLDTHGAPVMPEVLDLLAWVVERTGPVPVLLERDHKVPAIEVLLREREAIQAVYERALTRHREGAGEDREGAAYAVRGAEPGDDHARFDALIHAVQATVRDAEAPDAIAMAPHEWLADRGLLAIDEDALARLGPARLLLYRKLVRGGIARAVRVEIPRTAARLGAIFEAEVARFCDEELPRSHYLRDVAFELVEWASPTWRADPRVAGYLVDLARHELLAFDVATAEETAAAGDVAPLDLERPVRFLRAARVVRYEHAIHRLSAALDATDVPAREPTALLAYRDAELEIRHLELTPLAAAIVERLMAGETLKGALVGASSAMGQPLDASVLEGTSALLADLAERGVMLGAAP